jgi:hypothetical protein
MLAGAATSDERVVMKRRAREAAEQAYERDIEMRIKVQFLLSGALGHRDLVCRKRNIKALPINMKATKRKGSIPVKIRVWLLLVVIFGPHQELALAEKQRGLAEKEEQLAAELERRKLEKLREERMIEKVRAPNRPPLFPPPPPDLHT